jgi:hypothetical protein
MGGWYSDHLENAISQKIQGMQATAGTYTWTVKATDSASAPRFVSGEATDHLSVPS